MDRTANAGTAFKWSVGSNPTLSANTGPAVLTAGPLPYPVACRGRRVTPNVAIV